MVGRLVQKQNVGRGRQHPRERCAARLAAGEVRGVLIAAKAKLFQYIARRIAVIARSEPGLDISERGGKACEIRLLRKIADGAAGLHKTTAAIGFDETS